MDLVITDNKTSDTTTAPTRKGLKQQLNLLSESFQVLQIFTIKTD